MRLQLQFQLKSIFNQDTDVASDEVVHLSMNRSVYYARRQFSSEDVRIRPINQRKFQMQEAEEVVTIALHHLSQVPGHEITIKNFDLLTEGSRRNRLIRIHLENHGSAQPESLVIKQRVSRDDDNDPFLREWAATRFLSNLPNALRAQYCPHFYLGDPENRFFIMEDLGDQTRSVTWNDEEKSMDASLVQPLLGRDSSEACHGITSLMESLGKMHAATIGRYVEYSEHCDDLGIPADGLMKYQGAQVREIAQDLSSYLAPIGIQPEANVVRELETLSNRIESPDPFLAFVHGDPCPDNCLYFDGQLRIVDFEFSGYGHALLDAAFPRIAFPTCWCCSSLPENVVEQAEHAYRVELARGCAAAEDDKLFGNGMALACAFWTLMVMKRLPKLIDEDSMWGISSVRSRMLTRLDTVTGMHSLVEHFPATTHLFESTRAALLDRWDIGPLNLYPAFS